MGSAPPIPLQIDETMLSRLAHECARDMYPLETILQTFRIDPAYFQTHIVKHPRFMLFYAEAHALWNSSLNSKERSALKAAVVFEEWIGQANALLHKSDEPLMGKVKLAEFLARVAGIDKDKSSATAPGDRVVVNINLSAAGGGTTTIDKAAPVTLEGTASLVPAQ